MTTYELPPEPEVGARVRDHHGHVWTHTNDGWSHPELRSSGLSWGAVMAYASPAELIEPDPWPTAPLIVADWTSGGVEGGRGLLYRETDADQYWTIRENESVYPEHTGDTLTNVVPVTVVPVAALPVLWSALEQWLNGNGDPGSDTTRLVGAVINLREQIDALGVDL